MERKLAVLGLIALALGATGCGSDDEEGTPPEEDPGEHACEHVSETGTAVTAAADRATAPEIALSEEPYTVTLVAGQPSFVKIPGGEDALLFTKATGVVIGLYFEQETNSQLSAPEPNEFCPTEIPEHFDLELEAPAGAWYVELAPSASPDVWIALISAAGHAH
jgi:hypothetical protein